MFKHLKAATRRVVKLCLQSRAGLGLGLVLGLGLGLGLLMSSGAQALVVLQYHHISEDTPQSTSNTPAQFEAHLKILQQEKFSVIGLDELATLLREDEVHSDKALSDKILPDKTVIITFDDGYRSVYENAYPLLQRYGFPFAVFINTQPHDAENPNFMSWAQMKEMSAQGVIFANHSVSHPHLIRRLPNETQEAWETRVWGEISSAERTIQKRLKQHHRLFAYPFGEYGADLKQLLREAGYLGFGQHSGPVPSTSSPMSDPQALPRFPVGGVYGELEAFKTKIYSLPMPLSSVTVTDEAGDTLHEPELPAGVSRPRLTLEFQDERLVQQVNCFASGQGAIPVVGEDSRLIAQSPKPLSVGRSRYNCTASSGQRGRFYWYSEMFIRRQESGVWYDE